MKLSIIIPLYNCGVYIVDCLNSIYSSGLDESCYEVIVIDDGSRDDGPERVEKYAEAHSNLTFRSFENGGASAARNRGMELATGEYIWFVDADDRIVTEFLKRGYELLCNGQDIDLLCFNYRKQKKDGVEYNPEFEKDSRLTGLEYLRSGRLYLWNKIFSKRAIGDVRFLEGTKNIEDWLFDLMSISQMRNVMCVNDVGYVYNMVNMGSTSRSRSKRNLVKLSMDTRRIYRTLIDFIDRCDDAKIKDCLRDSLNEGMGGYLYSLYLFYSPKYSMHCVDECEGIGLYPVRRTGNRKMNLFLLLANRKRLLYCVIKLKRLLNK